MAKARGFSLLLFRAGATEWDEADRLSGSSDHPMSAGGRAKLEEVVNQIGSLDLDLILCAEDESSVETANLLASETGAKVRKIRGLDDMSLGLWEGLRMGDVAERYPSALKQWKGDPSSVRVPGGETLIEAEQRILESLVGVLERVKAGQEHVAVVVRPMAWGLIRCWLSGTPISRLWNVLKEAPMYGWYEIEREKLEQVGSAGVQS